MFWIGQWTEYFHSVKNRNCSIHLRYASVNGTFYSSPHENILSIALINIHYWYTIVWGCVKFLWTITWGRRPKVIVQRNLTLPKTIVLTISQRNTWNSCFITQLKRVNDCSIINLSILGNSALLPRAIVKTISQTFNITIG